MQSINLPVLEPRLQRCFEELTRQHLSATDDLAAGLRAFSPLAARGKWLAACELTDCAALSSRFLPTCVKANAAELA
jgi:hypothetical protein